jgi:hypothetical protein
LPLMLTCCFSSQLHQPTKPAEEHLRCGDCIAAGSERNETDCGWPLYTPTVSTHHCHKGRVWDTFFPHTLVCSRGWNVLP